MADKSGAVPVHIGFIMDGNRRWARERGLPDFQGHYNGYKAFKKVAEACFEQGVKYISIYAFSTENWKRDSSEVAYLMQLITWVAKKEKSHALKNNIRMRFLGRRDRLEPKVLKALERTEEATKHLTRGTIAVCVDYGGQQEIADAARRCLNDGLAPEDITPEAIDERLYGADIPAVDLIVRASGEQRLSNFMLWRAAYSELLFFEKHWPEVTKQDVAAIIEEYGRRSRRFGG